MADGEIKYYQEYRDQIHDFLGMFLENRDIWTPAQRDLPKDSPERQELLRREYEKATNEERDAFEKQIVNKPADIDEEKFGMYHPIAIAKAMVRNRGFTDDQGKLFGILRRSFNEEPETGLAPRHATPIIVGLAHLHAQMPLRHSGRKKPDICIITGDFTNMGQANEEIGRGNVNKAIHIICNLVKDSAEGKAGNVEVQGFRIGGDELGFVIYGRNAAEMKTILAEKIHPEINLLSARMGTDRIGHSKVGRLPGFGAAFACMDVTGSEEAINDHLAADIKKQKELDGYLRFGMTDAAGVERYIDQIYVPYLKTHPGTKEPSADAKLAKMLPVAAEARKYWESLIKPGGAYEKEFKHYKDNERYYGKMKGFENNPDNPGAFFAYEHEIYESKLRSLLHVKKPKPLTPQERIPFWRDEKPMKLEDPTITRMRWMMDSLGFKNIAEADTPLVKPVNLADSNYARRYRPAPELIEGLSPKRRRLLRQGIDLMHLFDAPDPVTRLKSKRLMADDADLFLKAQSDTDHPGVHVLQIDLTNLGGLNAIGEPLGNAVLRRLGNEVVRDALRANDPNQPNPEKSQAADFLYHEGNGSYKVLLPTNYTVDDISRVTTAIELGFRERIRHQSIVDFAGDTYARVTKGRSEQRSAELKADLQNDLNEIGNRPSTFAQIEHPKGKEQGIGVRFYDRLLKVHSRASADRVEAIIKDLEKITDEAKNRPGRSEGYSDRSRIR